MCTRSGSVDPDILTHLLRQGMDVDHLKNCSTGRAACKHARLAIGVVHHRLRQGIGRMLGSLGRVPDALVFTDVIGESMPPIRAAACEAFAFLGLRLDGAANQTGLANSDIACAESRVRVLVVRSREDWQMTRECLELLREA